MGALKAESSLAPAQLGRYRLVRPLGRGGMGAVFEAEHVDLGKRVAIKVMHAADEGAARRLVREGRAAAAIHHPHVVRVDDVGTDLGRPYLVMELLEGEDLAQRLRREGPLGPDESVRLLLPVLSGLAAVHDAGIVHRDVKPSNIFLAKRLEGIAPVVVDFGISKVPSRRTEPATSSRSVGGTPQYMAPEQLRGSAEVTSLSDQYALAIVLYECVTGGTPFWNEDYYELLHSIMTGSAVGPSELNPAVPAALDALILRALARDPQARFPNIRAFAAALLPFAGSQVASAWIREFAEDGGDVECSLTRKVLVRREHRPARPGVWVVAAAVAALALAVVALVRGRATAPGDPLAREAPARVEPQAINDPTTAAEPRIPGVGLALAAPWADATSRASLSPQLRSVAAPTLLMGNTLGTAAPSPSVGMTRGSITPSTSLTKIRPALAASTTQPEAKRAHADQAAGLRSGPRAQASEPSQTQASLPPPAPSETAPPRDPWADQK